MRFVHVVQSCHLDVGFDGSIQQVLSEYFTRYIPAAIATARAMRADKSLPDGWTSNFMCVADPRAAVIRLRSRPLAPRHALPSARMATR